MLTGFLLSVPGIMLALVGWILVQQRIRARRLKLVEAHACKLCGTPFSEALVEYLGGLGAGELRRMDAFQRRFASFKVRCHECSSVNICTRDGQPFKVLVDRDDPAG